MRLKRSTGVKKTARAPKPARFTAAMAAGAFALAVTALVAIAMWMPAQRPSRSMDIAISQQPSDQAAAPTVRNAVSDGTHDVPTVELASNTSEQKASVVTITGCLERDDDSFRLKDTSGTAAPQARTWRSGFIRKNNATVEVIDGSKKLKLRDHVGQRVSVTGTLVDREMQARSLQKVSGACGKAPRA